MVVKQHTKNIKNSCFFLLFPPEFELRDGSRTWLRSIALSVFFSLKVAYSWWYLHIGILLAP